MAGVFRCALVSALLLLFGQLAWGQTSIESAVQELQATAARGQFHSDAEAEQTGRLLVQLCWELVKGALKPATASRPFAQTFRFDTAKQVTAARVEKGQIVVSVGPLLDVALAATMLGRDIYVANGGEILAGPPVAYRPLIDTPLLPIIERLGDWLNGGVNFLGCPPQATDCRMLQGAAVMVGTLGFTLAHESAHLELGHGEGTQTLERELAADAMAYRVVARVLRDFVKELANPQDVDLAGKAGPPAMLMLYESRRMSRDWVGDDDPVILQYRTRRQRLLATLTDDEREAVSELIDPQTVDAGIGSVLIMLREPPDTIYIDGVQYRPAELLGQELSLPAGRHTMFSRSNQDVAYRKFTVTSGGRTRVNEVHNVVSCTATAQTAADLAKRRDWWALLIKSGAGAPCSPEVVPAITRYEAMHQLMLDFLIPEAPADLDSDEEIRRVDRWRRSARPLNEWR